MRVTLVNPPWQFNNPAKLPPLGLAYLGAVLREDGRSQVTLVDLNAEVQKPQAVLAAARKRVEATKPEVLGLSCTTVQAPFVIEFVRLYKKKYPDVPVVLGGIHASAAPEEMLRSCPADVVVHGEGEETLVEVLDALVEDRAAGLTRVKGISFRAGGGITRTEPQPLLKDLDSLPYPAYDLLPPLPCYQPLARKHVFSVTASRGCVHHCAFCSGSRHWHYQRWRTPESVAAEVRWLDNRYDLGMVRFEDDDLLTREAWSGRLLDLLEDIGVPFSCFARLDSLQEAAVERLAAAGCKEVYHGLETTSPRLWEILRKDMSKGLDLAGCSRLIAREIEAGVTPTVSAIIGIPTETEAEMQATVDFLGGLRARGARTQLWLLTPYPDTDIVREFAQDLVEVDRWTKFGQFDVFSQAARDAYGDLLARHKCLVPDFWMFRNEAGIEKTGRLWLEARGRLMGAFDFV